MTCNYTFRLNGLHISQLTVRRNQIKKGWPSKNTSLWATVDDPLLGETTMEINNDAFVLQIRPKGISSEDRSWLVDEGWRRISVDDAIMLLIDIDDRSKKKTVKK